MKYFKVFNTESEYLEYISSDKFITPNVSTLYDSTKTWITEEIHDYSKDYFTIESLEDNNEIKLYRINAGGNMDTLHIAASTDNGGTWTEFALDGSTENTTDITTLNQGEKVMFKFLSGATSRAGSSHTKIISTASFNVYGNVMSFVSAGDFTTATTLSSENSPLRLLNGSRVVSAENLVLPATTLVNSCYQDMFKGCTSLLEAPKLPATTLETYCYSGMFYGCTNLTTAPELPAKTLANNCYQSMFYGCTSLIEAPELPATTLAARCYRSMFGNCTNLEEATELPATTLASECYYYMFGGCTSLTTAPDKLPATTLASECYREMFNGCTSLTTAPELHATTLASNCYLSMFRNCTSLTTAPELPATEFSDGCYNSMFIYCTSLTTAPSVLPATTLRSDCYRQMFYGCTSLTTAPELPATTLVNNCYREMFKGCSNLNYIKCLAIDISASDCTTGWVNGVSATGTFVKSSSMNDWTIGADGIPTNWTVHNDTYVEVTGVTISASATTVNKGSTYTLTANVLPSNAYDQVVSWSTSDSNVATVSDGVVTGVGCGDATITVTTHEKGYTATCNMSVENHVTSVDLDAYQLYLGSGGTYQLEATVLPSDACDKSVTWSSSDVTIATVDSNGLVSGVTIGEAVVTVTSVDNSSATKNCSVTVTEPQHVSGVTLSDTEITVNKDETYTLTATVLPIDAVDKSVTWASSDDTIATVDSNGVVNGVTSGNATVTVTTTDGGFTAQCSVSVSEEHDYSKDYFTIESLEDNNDIKIQKVNGTTFTIYYSIDGGETWSGVKNTPAGATISVINNGEKILLKGNVSTYASGWNNYNHFIGTKQFKVYGNAMSLINGSGFTENSEFDNTKTNHFVGLFRDSTNLVDASNLILPAQTLYTNSYNGMFRGATSLQHGPQMLATTPTGTECCASMFEGCINLEEPIEIKFTTLAQQCCFRMFCMNRNSKITTPKMTKSPILRCNTSATDCYTQMFAGNGNLNEITCLLQTPGGTTDWIKNAGAATGTFYKNPSATWSQGGTGNVPSGWDIVDYVEE